MSRRLPLAPMLLALAVAGLLTAGGHRSAPAGPAAAPLLSAGVYFAGSRVGDPHGAVVAVQTTRPLVALTFDDGPDPRWTPPILRALRRAGAHATFFDIGRRVAAHPGLARREAAGGDEVGNHTLTHPLLIRLSPAAVRREIRLGRRALGRAGLPVVRWFRPPHGAFDRVVTGAARAAGERTIGWDVPLDRALRGRSVRAAVRRVVARIRPGSIILAHDGGGAVRARTVRAVPLLLAALRARGLRVVSVGTLLRARRTGA